MKSLTIHLALAAALLAPASISAQTPAAADVPALPSITLPAELDRVLRDYERSWAAGDVDALARLFTEDGHVSNAAGWVRGPDAIRRQYANASGPLHLRALSYAIDGSVAYIIGAYGFGPGAAQRDMGKFLLALRRGDDGNWLIAADLDNPNQRPGGE